MDYFDIGKVLQQKRTYNSSVLWLLKQNSTPNLAKVLELFAVSITGSLRSPSHLFLFLEGGLIGQLV